VEKEVVTLKWIIIFMEILAITITLQKVRGQLVDNAVRTTEAESSTSKMPAQNKNAKSAINVKHKM